MAQSVVAFVGENANGILESQSRRFMALLAPLGFEGHVLRIAEPGTAERLQALLDGGIAFGWGYAGVGARLTLEGRSLWSAVETPFISVLADPPYMMPTNHHVDSAYVVNGYVYREWLDVQQRHFQSPQLAALLPLGVIGNTDRDRTAWSDRPHRMVFVKSGGDPAAQRAGWALWPVRLRRVMEDSADALCRLGTGAIGPVVHACLASHELDLQRRPAILFGVLHELDQYVRSYRATVMVRAMLGLPVDIIGDGWAHVSAQGGRARFHPSMPAEGLESLYSQTQILVNSSPNFGSGAHERVLRGFAARCCVVSDDNDHSRSHLRGLPSYHVVEWHAPDLPERLAAVFHDGAAYDDRTDPALAYVRRQHDPSAFLSAMSDLADVARLQSRLSCYALDAA